MTDNTGPLVGVAATAFVSFVVLGLRVSNRPLMRLDADAVYFRAQFTPLALFFTYCGRLIPLTTACIGAIAIFALMRISILIPMLVTASQLISQMAIEYAKTLFKRTRPDYWIVGEEAGHSYPSGHAATAIIFFIGWAIIAALSRLPLGFKDAAVALLVVWAAGIIWSRLALGAHYLTDVLGGMLFGAAWLCALFAASSHFYGILR
jgi:membrane-associated phospholipid phosphatase